MQNMSQFYNVKNLLKICSGDEINLMDLSQVMHGIEVLQAETSDQKNFDAYYFLAGIMLCALQRSLPGMEKKIHLDEMNCKFIQSMEDSRKNLIFSIGNKVFNAF